MELRAGCTITDLHELAVLLAASPPETYVQASFQILFCASSVCSNGYFGQIWRISVQRFTPRLNHSGNLDSDSHFFLLGYACGVLSHRRTCAILMIGGRFSLRRLVKAVPHEKTSVGTVARYTGLKAGAVILPILRLSYD